MPKHCPICGAESRAEQSCHSCRRAARRAAIQARVDAKEVFHKARLEALEGASWDITNAAASLGIARLTLTRWIERNHLERDHGNV